ncbi:hypothetical protein BVRB_5g125600 [Beta vulgaris subsp. vulgaris]|uniref:Uncharacterized protein n=1 Tax=Beta vulgaris subsp. vulgaris TaxID=3555 RepID=A0A0J8E3C0_BETVV|nr:hypothetical protein BVRB_5g125600 [Beta vulgaris subsp. vulgaris]
MLKATKFSTKMHSRSSITKICNLKQNSSIHGTLTAKMARNS